MKRLALALVLMCVLSTSIFAGNMPAGGFVEPPQPPTTSSTSSSMLVTVMLTILSLR